MLFHKLPHLKEAVLCGFFLMISALSAVISPAAAGRRRRPMFEVSYIRFTSKWSLMISSDLLLSTTPSYCLFIGEIVSVERVHLSLPPTFLAPDELFIQLMISQQSKALAGRET